MFGTSGRTDDISLGAAITCQSSAFGAHMVVLIDQSCRNGSNRGCRISPTWGDKR